MDSGTIVLQFVSNNSLGSKVIEWFDHGLYSHVDSVMPDGSLLGARNDVIQGFAKGVQVRPASYVMGYAHVKRVELITSATIAEAYYEFVKSQIGKPYDTTAIAGFIAGRNWLEEDSWFCSELSTKGLVVSKFLQHLPSAPCNKIAPDDELLICSMFTDV